MENIIEAFQCLDPSATAPVGNFGARVVLRGLEGRTAYSPRSVALLPHGVPHNRITWLQGRGKEHSMAVKGPPVSLVEQEEGLSLLHTALVGRSDGKAS